MRIRRAVPYRVAATFAIPALMAGASCNVSPQPIPPAGPVADGSAPNPGVPDASPNIVEIHIDLLDLRHSSGQLHLVGSAGAVFPGGAGLDIVNLSRELSPARITVGADGSFDVPVELSDFETARLVATASGVRSTPLDITINSAADDSTDTRPRRGGTTLSSCLLLSPSSALSFEATPFGPIATRDIAIENRCSSEVVLGEIAIRPAAPTFGTTPAPGAIAPGAKATATLSFTPGAAAQIDTNLVFRIDGPERGVRALSVSAIVRGN